MKSLEVAEKIGFSVAVAPATDQPVTGCYIGDLLSWVMSNASAGDLWLTVMGNVNVMAVSKLLDCAAVVVCEGAPIDPEALAQAQAHGLAVYQSPRPIYDVALQVGQLLD